MATASDGLEALNQARSRQPNLIVLDLMLPRLDGLEVCRILRSEMSAPILMLTARTDEVDKVVGLELGADDSIDIMTDIGYSVAEMYSVGEAAEKLRLSARHVRLLLSKGDIEGKKLGHDWVVLSLDYKRKRKPRTKKGGGHS